MGDESKISLNLSLDLSLSLSLFFYRLRKKIADIAGFVKKKTLLGNYFFSKQKTGPMHETFVPEMSEHTG
jgi:hypothetical protein